MASGRQTASGGISLWPICLGINLLLPNTTLPWDLGGKVIFKSFKSNSYPVNYKIAFSKYLNS